jgi:hypothetical protein
VVYYVSENGFLKIKKVEQRRTRKRVIEVIAEDNKFGISMKKGLYEILFIFLTRE